MCFHDAAKISLVSVCEIASHLLSSVTVLTGLCLIPHYANTPMQYTAIFHGCKNVHFHMKIFKFFVIFALNIDRGYTLEPPQ